MNNTGQQFVRSRERTSSAGGQQREREGSERPAGKPVNLVVRVLYFSRDGGQADNGQLIEIEMSSSSTVEELLQRAREDAGVSNKGKLLFKMRPLTDMNATIEESGVLRDPQGLHLMLSRKHRPPEVADRAACVAAELSDAMAKAAAEAAARPPRVKRRPPSEGSQH